MHPPRQPLPSLPTKNKLIPTREMAEFLEVGVSKIRRVMKEAGLRGCRTVSLAQLGDLLLTIGPAARLLSCSFRTVERRIESGLLPARRVAGGYRRIRLADILSLRRELQEKVREAKKRKKARARRVAGHW